MSLNVPKSVNAPPMSNLERQRAFCRRNPGYYRKYSARRRTRTMQLRAAQQAAAAARAAEAAAAAEAANGQPLMLPAPAEPVETPDVTLRAA